MPSSTNIFNCYDYFQRNEKPILASRETGAQWFTGHSGSGGTVNLSLFKETGTNKSHSMNITGHAWGSPNKLAAQLEKPFDKVKIIR